MKASIDSKILDIVTYVLTIVILFNIIIFFNKNSNEFPTEMLKYIAICYYLFYSIHLFLIFRSFRKLKDENSNPNKEFGNSKWLNSKYEIRYRYIVIILVLCVPGHLSEVIAKLLKELSECLNFNKYTFELSPIENFTFYSWLLSNCILIWDLIGLLVDFIIPKDFANLKRNTIELNWPTSTIEQRASFKEFFNLFPSRTKYLVGDIIAILFWYQFYFAIFTTHKFGLFMEILSVFIIVYFFLMVYRIGAVVFKYE